MLRLEFDSVVPLETGCVVDIVFPDDFELSTSDSSFFVEGMNLFEAKRVMSGALDPTRNSFTITDGCRLYREAGQTGILDFSVIINPDSIKETGSVEIYIKDVNQYAIA